MLEKLFYNTIISIQNSLVQWYVSQRYLNKMFRFTITTTVAISTYMLLCMQK